MPFNGTDPWFGHGTENGIRLGYWFFMRAMAEVLDKPVDYGGAIDAVGIRAGRLALAIKSAVVEAVPDVTDASFVYASDTNTGLTQEQAIQLEFGIMSIGPILASGARQLDDADQNAAAAWLAGRVVAVATMLWTEFQARV